MSLPGTGPAPTRVPLGSGEVNLFRQGTGRPVVVLHAAGGAGAWNPYLERLSAHFDVIAPDHPGFGLSDELPEVATMADLVQHYVALFDVLGLDRFDLVGASFGGWLAAEVASTVPERVERLVLMAPAGLHLPEAPPANLPSMSQEQLVRALFWDGAIADAALSAPPSPEAAAQGARDGAAFGRFAASGPVLLHNPELPPRLARITSRTLVLTAEVDDIVPRAHSEAYAAQIAGAELHVLTEIGHALYQEKPDVVADEVIAFLSPPVPAGR
ncbi:alpha/beta fold hydrolase [Modestobacter versicolor]|uniref:alpha/beta fold hydrolase n=1 Tax=Modestobacter versicolor TaxID=429133 RepID=UPI0034DF6FDD